MKAKECDFCKFAEYHGEWGEKLVCLKGHKPRFYKPRHDGDDYGWRRRCDDFEGGYSGMVIGI